MAKTKYNWKQGENETQNYYDTRVDGKYLLVFANKADPNTWMGMIDYKMIRDHSNSPDVMMKKVEYCYENKTVYPEDMTKKVESGYEKGIVTKMTKYNITLEVDNDVLEEVESALREALDNHLNCTDYSINIEK